MSTQHQPTPLHAPPTIAIPYLDRFRARVLARHDSDPIEWQADQIVLNGLGLGLHETFRFLFERRPDLPTFERWICDHTGTRPDPDRCRWITAAVERTFAGHAPAGHAAGSAPAFDDNDLRHWEERGYVVLRGTVSPAACQAAADAIWTHLGLSANDPDGWTSGEGTEGIFVTLTQHAAFDANRTSPRIRAAFAQLLGTDDLLATVDRGGFNPPERAGRPFRGQGLHWDVSLAPPIPLRLQGLLYLTDTPAEQGAFRCVPGFHKRIDRWLATLPAGVDPRAANFDAEAVPIAGGAGDMVIWHAALPHGASPNRGTRPRLVQYLYYYSTVEADNRPWV